MADASLYSRFIQPARSVSDYIADADRADLARLQLEGQRRQNALAQVAYGQQLAEAQQKTDRFNALQRAAQGWTPETTTDQRIASLRANPLTWDAADTLEKSDLDRQKTRATVSKDTAEAQAKVLENGVKRLGFVGQLAGGVRDQATYDSALSQMQQSGIDVAALGAPAQYDPAVVQRFQAWALSEQDRLAQQWKAKEFEAAQARDAEARRHNMAGEQTAAGQLSVARGNLAVAQGNLGLRRQELAQGGSQYDAERGVLVNTRTGEARPVMSGGQPLGAKDKAMTEGQAKANLFGTRAQEADKILSDLAKQGADSPGRIQQAAAGVPLIGGALGAGVNMLPPVLGGPNAQQQQVEQAQRDFINAVLRRESGAVIAADEFSNAARQYFPQPGNTDAVKAQKARSRQIAVQGILSEVPERSRLQVSPAGGGSQVDSLLKKYGAQ